MKIICIGRYEDHIEELNNKVPRTLFFLKPDTAIRLLRHPFFIPHHSNDIHYEVELLLRLIKETYRETICT